MAYATEAELADWMQPTLPPENAAALLRSASYLIRSETKKAIYNTTDGLPSDAAVLAAFRDATSAQAAFWAASGIDPSLGAAGVKPLAASKSIGGASIAYSVYAATAEARANSAGALGPEAFFILEDAGLLGGSVVLL